MPRWEPDTYSKDPTANALLNIAASIYKLADAQENLLYAVKYSRKEGLSLAEAVEVGAEKAGVAIAMALNGMGARLEGVLDPTNRPEKDEG